MRAKEGGTRKKEGGGKTAALRLTHTHGRARSKVESLVRSFVGKFLSLLSARVFVRALLCVFSCSDWDQGENDEGGEGARETHSHSAHARIRREDLKKV